MAKLKKFRYINVQLVENNSAKMLLKHEIQNGRNTAKVSKLIYNFLQNTIAA